MSADGRIERARLLYERAVFGGDASAVAVAERSRTGTAASLPPRTTWWKQPTQNSDSPSPRTSPSA